MSLVQAGPLPMKAVVLAGGRGTRLSPYTSVLPKPLMPLGERSVLEILLEHLRQYGFRDVTLCVGYLSHLIRAVFDNGRVPGVKLDFVHEQERLGTAGPLRLVPDLTDSFLAMNGDVLTSLDLRALADHHRRSGNLVTIAAQHRMEKVDFGILNIDNRSARVVGYEEKPEFELRVSMGIYVMQREVLDWIPPGYFDFPDLVVKLVNGGEPVGVYMHQGYWCDIGRHDDYERAVADWSRRRDDPDSAIDLEFTQAEYGLG
jgi:NDP-mannose synthase